MFIKKVPAIERERENLDKIQFRGVIFKKKKSPKGLYHFSGLSLPPNLYV